MPIIELTPEGGGNPVRVQLPDSFSQASPEVQQQTIHQMTLNLGAAGGKVAAPDTSFSGAIQQGAHDALAGLGATASVLGAQGIGQDLTNAVQAPAGYQGASLGDVANRAKSGNYLGAAEEAARGAVEAAPSIAGQLGATALGSVAGPVGAAALGTAYGTAENAGSDIQARAAANGNSTPSAADMAIGGATGLAQGAIGQLGLGKVPGVSKLVEGQGVKAALGKIGLDGAAGGANAAIGQIGTTAGTQQGYTPDLGQIGTSALESAGGRALTLVPEAVGRRAQAGAQMAGNAISSAALDPLTDAHAAAIARINQALPTFADPENNIRPNSPNAAKLNGMQKQLVPQMNALAAHLAELPGMPNDALNTVLKPIIAQAAVHNSSISPGLRSAVAALPIPEQARSTFMNGVDDLDALSQGKMLNRQSGPFAAMGSKLGGVATTLAMAHADPLGAGVNALFGTGLENKLGGKIGGAIDSLAGTNQPLAVLQRAQAMKQLQQGGIQPGQDSLQAVPAAVAAMQAARQSTPQPLSPEQIGQQRAASNQAGMLAKLGPDHPVGQAAQTALQQAGLQPSVDQALAQFQANQPVANAQAKLQQAQASNKQAVKDDAAQAIMQAAQARANAKAAFGLSPEQALVNKLATKHQTALDADGVTPSNPEPISLTANAAAMNEASRRAMASKRLGGEIVPEDVAEPSQAPQTPPATPAPQAPQAAPQAAPMAPGGVPFGQYLAERALGQNGVALDPAHITAGLDAAAAAGKLTPDQYAAYGSSMGRPLMGGLHEGPIQAILSHAIAAKTGADAAPVQSAFRRGGGTPNGGDNPVRNAYQHATAATSFHSAVKDASDLAAKAGDTDLSHFLNTLRLESNVSTKRQMAAEFFAQHPQSQGLAQQLGIGAIIEHGNPKTK